MKMRFEAMTFVDSIDTILQPLLSADDCMEIMNSETPTLRRVSKRGQPTPTRVKANSSYAAFITTTLSNRTAFPDLPTNVAPKARSWKKRPRLDYAAAAADEPADPSTGPTPAQATEATAASAVAASAPTAEKFSKINRSKIDTMLA